MYIQLVRESFTNTSTEGQLLVNGTFECYTLEDTDRELEAGGEKIYGKTAVPKGKYNVIVTHSNRFGKDMPLLEDVEGFTGVRIHTGNTSEDTDGCILVGATNRNESDDFIGSSRVAYGKLLPQIQKTLADGELVTLEIV